MCVFEYNFFSSKFPWKKNYYFWEKSTVTKKWVSLILEKAFFSYYGIRGLDEMDAWFYVLGGIGYESRKYKGVDGGVASSKDWFVAVGFLLLKWII